MLVDTHCHLDFDDYQADLEQILERAANAQVTRVIIPATDKDTGESAFALAQRFPNIYSAAGIHPNSTAEYAGSDLATIEAQAKRPKVLAIGEIGLDYYREWSPKDKQRIAFEQQLALASRLELPVIIHNREAHDDVISVLADWIVTLPESLKERPGVLHSFSAPRHIAERALELGFYLGFTGPLTYKNADDLRLIAGMVPLERIVVETDGPFLTPMPHRGKRNEPAYVRFTADRLAALRNLSIEEIEAATTANAERLFHLPAVQ
jgi:TatD DNase family protein